jgi:hypothetical protein
MARIAARNARLFVGATNGAAASQIAFVSTFELNQTTERFDVTAFGDGTKTFVAGLPDASGSFNGFFDTETAQTYAAGSDGLARRMYFYPDFSNTPGIYWFGTAFLDFALQTDVGGAATISGTWSAATPISKVG